MDRTITSNNLTFESLGDAFNLGLPIFLLLISIASFIWFGIEIKKKRIEFRSLISWFVWNVIYTVTILYVLIVAILHLYNIQNIPNILNNFAHFVFGIDMQNGKQWIIIIILSFISFTLIKTLQNSIKIAKLELKMNELNKQVAILMGQVNRTTDFKNLPLATKAKTSKEIKAELKEKIKIQKAELKAKEKMRLLSENDNNQEEKDG